MVRRPLRWPRRGAPPARPGLPTSYYVARYSLFGVVGVAFGAVAYSVFWFYAATEFREGVANWFADRQAEGFSARYQRLEISGFPTSLRVLLNEPAFGRRRSADAPDPQDWQWQGERLIAETRPWNIRRLSVLVQGPQQLSFFHGLRPVILKGQLGRLNADLTFHGDGLPRVIQLDVENLDIASPDRRLRIAAVRANLAARRLFPDSPTEKTPTFTIKVTAGDIQIPRLWRLPLGYKIARLSVNASILGEVPPAEITTALSKWRDAGGILEVANLDGQYGPLRARASGTVALDAALQPVAALTARLQGFFPTVDALRAANLIRSRDAVMAKVVLGALSRRPRGGGPAAISLPLSIQKQTLYAGPVPLMKIPPIDWDRRTGGVNTPTRGLRSKPVWRQ